jgi:hypothetical protein
LAVELDRQFGASVGIPAKYYDRLREASTELLAQNVNYWLQNEPSKHMIRMMCITAPGETVRDTARRQ